MHPQLAQCVTGKRQDLHVNMQCTVVAVLACRNVSRAGQRCEDGLGLPRPLQVEQRNTSAKFPDAVGGLRGDGVRVNMHGLGHLGVHDAHADRLLLSR